MKFFKFLFFLSLCFFFIGNVNATNNYKSQTLKEACNEEGIVCNYNEYPYDDSKPTIYIFRRTGCSFCKDMMSYIASIIDEYKGQINVVTYEAYTNKMNLSLARLVANNLGKELEGFPYTIIGSKSFVGYQSSYNKEIISAIENLVSKKDEFDAVLYVLNELSTDSEPKSSKGYVLSFIFSLSIVLLLFFGYKLKQ